MASAFTLSVAAVCIYLSGCIRTYMWLTRLSGWNSPIESKLLQYVVTSRLQLRCDPVVIKYMLAPFIRFNVNEYHVYHYTMNTFRVISVVCVWYVAMNRMLTWLPIYWYMMIYAAMKVWTNWDRCSIVWLALIICTYYVVGFVWILSFLWFAEISYILGVIAFKQFMPLFIQRLISSIASRHKYRCKFGDIVSVISAGLHKSLLKAHQISQAMIDKEAQEKEMTKILSADREISRLAVECLDNIASNIGDKGVIHTKGGAALHLNKIYCEHIRDSLWPISDVDVNMYLVQPLEPNEIDGISVAMRDFCDALDRALPPTLRYNQIEYKRDTERVKWSVIYNDLEGVTRVNVPNICKAKNIRMYCTLNINWNTFETSFNLIRVKCSYVHPDTLEKYWLEILDISHSDQAYDAKHKNGLNFLAESKYYNVLQDHQPNLLFAKMEKIQHDFQVMVDSADERALTDLEHKYQPRIRKIEENKTCDICNESKIDEDEDEDEQKGDGQLEETDEVEEGDQVKAEKEKDDAQLEEVVQAEEGDEVEPEDEKDNTKLEKVEQAEEGDEVEPEEEKDNTELEQVEQAEKEKEKEEDEVDQENDGKLGSKINEMVQQMVSNIDNCDFTGGYQRVFWHLMFAALMNKIIFIFYPVFGAVYTLLDIYCLCMRGWKWKAIVFKEWARYKDEYYKINELQWNFLRFLFVIIIILIAMIIMLLSLMMDYSL